MPVSTTPVQFRGHTGEVLAARLEQPDGPPRGYALFAHCFTCSKDVNTGVHISRALAARGFGVLRFDFTGLGESQGEFAETNFSSNLEDLRLAADFLRTHYEAPQLLVGHSLGGAAILAVAGDIPEVRAVATLEAPSDPEHVQHLFADAMPEIDQAGEVQVQLAGRTFRITRQFVDDIRQHTLNEKIANLGKALMILHSPDDQVVDIAHAREIYEAAKHPKSFVCIDGADHMLSRRDDTAYVGNLLSAWSQRYIGRHEPRLEAERTSARPAGTVTVDELDGQFAQSVHAGGHPLIADEPESNGGTARGPSPYDYLLAALGSCTAMTLRMYVRHKGLDVSHIGVRLNHRKVHAEDCRDCDKDQARLDHIERRIHLDGALSEAQRQRLREIADRCPVHRTLTSVTRIETRLADD